MRTLVVKTTQLENLATKQEDAATSYAGATSATAGVMKDLRFTHGAISVAFIHEVDSTLDERTTAINALTNASTGAAAALRAAKKAYAITDTELGEKLDKEMVDR